jgi:putative lipoic acid-binding regulatory protein
VRPEPAAERSWPLSPGGATTRMGDGMAQSPCRSQWSAAGRPPPRVRTGYRDLPPHIGPTMNEETLLRFPTDFPIKVMGKADDDFRSLVVGILARHFADIDEARIEERPSSAGRYLGITVIVRAQNKAQIDAAYMDLTACQRVLVAL